VLEVSGEGLKFAQRMIGTSPANQRLRPARWSASERRERLWQITHAQVEAALVSVDRATADPRAGRWFRFQPQQYNHVMQALRQPGSSFKPLFIRGAREVLPRRPSSTMRR